MACPNTRLAGALQTIRILRRAVVRDVQFAHFRLERER